MNPYLVDCPNFRWITYVRLKALVVALMSLCVAVISGALGMILVFMLPYGDPEILVRDLKLYVIFLSSF